VLVTPTAVIPIEFKVGAKKFQQADYEQAWDFRLDLKNFHAPSHAAAIFPILCATEAPKSDRRWKPPHADGVRPPFCCNWQSLGTAIALALDEVGTAPAPITPSTWGTGSFSPTPTIIEAARSLYARHTVHDITRSDAGAVNLAVTSAAVERIIAQARERRRKAIVFVTGVPGAGKTLVGLNVATRHGSRDDAAHAVFPSSAARQSASAFSRLSRCASRSRMYCMKPSKPPCISSSCRRISCTSATIGSSAS
jgi:hypothetical protein